MATDIINVKELRASMPEVLKKVRQGDHYTVIYRSRPAFKIVAVDAEEEKIKISKDQVTSEKF